MALALTGHPHMGPAGAVTSTWPALPGRVRSTLPALHISPWPCQASPTVRREMSQALGAPSGRGCRRA